MINRRFLIVLPALPSGGHAEQLEQTSEDFLRLLLEMANMRVPTVAEARIVIHGWDENHPSGDAGYADSRRTQGA
jgi:hypothetical protein